MSKNLVRTARSLRPREIFAGLALIAISVIAASCNSDATGPGAVEPPIPLPKEILSTLWCKATPSTQTLSCSETPDALGNVLPSYMLGVGTDGLEMKKIIIGGQNTNVKLTSSNVVNNTTTHDFSFDVNVRNLRPQAIGTIDGVTTDSSLAVFFYSGPTTTGGSGVTSVSNPSGVTAFTGPNQPYFQYKEMVAQNATSSNKNWILHYDPTVTSFSFLLLVSANVKYPEGYIDVFPSPGGVSVSATLQMTDSVRDALGYARADQSETWSLSDSTKASIDSNGLLTGTANGTVVVTATQGQAVGSSTITVSGGVTPTAVVDSSAANSAPGSAFHTALNTQYVLAAPGILSNDTPGNPAGTVSTFGADSLGGAVTDHAAGSTVSPLPGHADGSLTVGANGAVTFTPPTAFTGYYAFHYRNTNANGSTSALVRIAVGVRPSAGNSTYSPNLLGNVKINTATSTNTKVNATGDRVVYHLVSNTNGAAIVQPDGTYIFAPALGYTGPASFIYNVSNGFGTSADATVSFTVASRIWFVAASAGGTGDGRYGSPLKCLVGANCLSAVTMGANDIVHIASGTYANADAFFLTNGMKIIGQGASGAFADASNANLTWPADAGPQPGTGGTRPMLNSGGSAVLIGGGSNLIRGLNMGTASQASLSGLTIGGMTVGNAAIINPSGGAVLLTSSGGSVTIDLDSAVATGGTNGINLHKQSGTFTSGLTRINNPSGTAITVDSSGAISLGTTVVRKTTTSGIGVNLLQNTSTTFGSLVDSTSVGPTMLITNGGTIAINGGNLNSVGGIGIDATNTAFSGTGFTSVNVSGTGGSGINLNSVTGTLAMGGGSITGGSNAGFRVSNGSSVTLTYSGTITAGAGGRPVNFSNGGVAAACPTATLSGNITSTSNGILVQDCNSGTITFSGASKLLKTTTNKGVQLASNTGATINFTNGGLVDSTTTGNAFEATGGGTISVTGTGNQLNSVGGIALDVTSTTIGANALTFQSISASGGTNGIFLSGTGSNGLTVSGIDGGCGWTGSATTTADCDGGTIQNTTSRGASFINASNISLKYMNFINASTVDVMAANTGLSTGDNLSDNASIHLQTVTNAAFDRIVISGGAEQGINGNTVTNFTLQNSSLANTGNASDEDGLHFYNMLGTNTISNNSIVSSGDDNVNIQNASGTSTIAISGGQFNTGVRGSGLLFGPRGTTNTSIAISGVTSNNNFSGGVVADASDGSTMKLEVSGSAITNNNDGISLSGASGDVRFDIHDNTDFSGTDHGVINVLKAAFSVGGTLQGKVRNNTLVVADGQIGDGISVLQFGGGALNVGVTGNSITYQGTQRAMLFQAGQDGAGSLDATVTGNAINMKLDGTGNAATGILAQVAVASPGGDNASLCADIGGAGGLGNVFTHSLGGNMPSGEIRVRQRFVTTVKLRGYTDANDNNAAVVAYLAGRNTLVNSPTATATNEVGVTAGAGGFVNTAGGAACTQPIFP